eukprot:1549097-Ditylum_brightwellii.AAC.1
MCHRGGITTLRGGAGVTTLGGGTGSTTLGGGVSIGVTLETGKTTLRCGVIGVCLDCSAVKTGGL